MHQGHFDGKHGDSLDDIRGYQAKTARYLFPLAKGKVLDVGASEGFFGPPTLPCTDYHAIDIQPRANLVRKATIHDVASENFYDLIIFCHVLEHVHDPVGELTKARKLLARNGHVFVAVPHASAPWAHEYESHLWMFNENNLPRVAALAGLTIKDIFRVNFRRDCEELWALMSR